MFSNFDSKFKAFVEMSDPFFLYIGDRMFNAKFFSIGNSVANPCVVQEADSIVDSVGL